jgi:excinuclease ABC subunit C
VGRAGARRSQDGNALFVVIWIPLRWDLEGGRASGADRGETARISRMAPVFGFAHRVAFVPEEADTILRGIPARAGVFALRGERESDQPYLMRAADVRRRLRRLLLPPEAVDADGRPVLTKRLNLRDRVRWIEWTETGSEFESVLLLYRATHALFGEAEARKRLRLHCPYFLRVTMGHDHPRVFVSNKMSRRALRESFGPFASRAAAERVAEAVGDLFKVRRCHEDLQVHPEHPGCVYGEMGRCLAPCKVAVTANEYRAEAERVFAYLRTRGESLMAEIAARRDAASEAMDFEGAASLHRQWEKVKGIAQGADPLVRAAHEVRAVVVQAAAPVTSEGGEAAQEAAVFLLDGGRLVGPERLSTLGVRAVREQTAVGSSLFAQPLMLAPVPEGFSEEGVSSPEERAKAVLAHLEQQTGIGGEPEPSERGDALALFKRWYFRPEKQRAGEVLLPNADGSWPLRRLLNAAARVVLGPPAQAQAVNRDGAKALAEAADGDAEQVKTRVLHPGREGVERVVPVLPKRKRSRGKALSPGEVIV